MGREWHCQCTLRVSWLCMDHLNLNTLMTRWATSDGWENPVPKHQLIWHNSWFVLCYPTRKWKGSFMNVSSERDLSWLIHRLTLDKYIYIHDIYIYKGNDPCYIPGFHPRWKQWIPEPVRMTHGMSGFCSRSLGLVKQTEATFTNMINGILATPPRNQALIRPY